MTLVFSYKEEKFEEGVNSIKLIDVKFMLKLMLVLFLITGVLFFSIFIAFKASHNIFRPLRKLNRKMRDIFADGMKRDLDQEDAIISKEISDLYQVFRSLIKTKKFENNDFKNKPDALAVIDLAEACNMFENDKEPNQKAAGICYSNIGNIQYKQGHYIQAAENFFKAVKKAEDCLDQHKK